MRRALRFLALGLVLLFVMMASALTAMRFAIHGREVNVPNLMGRSIPEAEQVANDLGLIFVVENKFYSDRIPAGRIVSQFPAPGAQVRKGWRVRGAESMGPQKSSIPSLVGQSTRAAEINVSRRGLELASIAVARLEGLPPNQIVGQDPPAHASGVVSPKVNLLATAPDADAVYIMPSFIGRHLAEVAPRLEEFGMKLGELKEVNSSVKTKSFSESTVIVKQTPAPGQRIAAGTTVYFEILR